MSVRYMIVGLNYGCEVAPTLNFLRIVFPEHTFSDERTLHGTFSSSWAIFSEGDFDAKELDRMRDAGSAFRDGFQKGFLLGFNDAAKHGT